MSDFKEKLTLMLIEKLALALVLALFGYLLSWRLEQYKAVEARNAEVAKRGLTALESVWDAYLAYEPAVNSLAEDLKNPPTVGGNGSVHANQVRATRKALEDALHKNELWLPQRSVSRIREFLARANNLPLNNSENADQLIQTARDIKDQLVRSPDKP